MKKPEQLIGEWVAELQEATEDIRKWTEVRLELAKLDAEDAVNGLIRSLIQLILVLIVAFFVLVTLALGLGWLLGHPFWGFLTVTLGMVLGMVLLGAIKPRFWRFKPEYAVWEKSALVQKWLLPRKPEPDTLENTPKSLPPQS